MMFLLKVPLSLSYISYSRIRSTAVLAATNSDPYIEDSTILWLLLIHLTGVSFKNSKIIVTDLLVTMSLFWYVFLKNVILLGLPNSSGDSSLSRMIFSESRKILSNHHTLKKGLGMIWVFLMNHYPLLKVFFNYQKYSYYSFHVSFFGLYWKSDICVCSILNIKSSQLAHPTKLWYWECTSESKIVGSLIYGCKFSCREVS